MNNRLALDARELDLVCRHLQKSERTTYTEMARILGADRQSNKVHYLANCLYATLLALPTRGPLKKPSGEKESELQVNRLKDAENWRNALFEQNGRHKPFIGRIAFETYSGQIVCHPTSEKISRILLEPAEIRIGASGMYASLKVFRSLCELPNEYLVQKNREQKYDQALQAEKLKKLWSLQLAERDRVRDGYLYKLREYKQRLCRNTDEESFRRDFLFLAVNKDPQLRRVLLALYFLVRSGKPWEAIRAVTKRIKKGISISTVGHVPRLAMYANIGPMEMDSILEFTDFSGLDYYYVPPSPLHNYGEARMYLASQLSTITDLKAKADQGPDDAQDDPFDNRLRTQVALLGKILKVASGPSSLRRKLTAFLQRKRIGCILDLSLDSETSLCASKIFVLTLRVPDPRELVARISPYLDKLVGKTIYYPSFRFRCCTSYGWHRFDFDEIFSRSLSLLSRKYLLRFYAIGGAGDVSHSIAPGMVRAVGKIFDHFKAVRRDSGP